MLATLLDTLWYGPQYAGLKAMLNYPQALDSVTVWDQVTRSRHRAVELLLEHYPPLWWRRWLLRPWLEQKHRVGIEAHYDVSNRFYQLFLDKEYMFYSAADFDAGHQTLERAQAKKAAFLGKLLGAEPHHEVLDLGCGWGSMLRYLHQTGVPAHRLHGYTLSTEQARYNREYHEFRVSLKNFVTEQIPDQTFDRIISVGAWEHVRHRDLDSTLSKLHRALKPGGRLVKQFFCPLVETVPQAAITAQLFFPGSFTPAYPTQVKAFEAAGFRIVSRSVHDYRPTLKAWSHRLAQNREQALKEVGVSVFNRYVVFFAISHAYFESGEPILMRWTLEKA